MILRVFALLPLVALPVHGAGASAQEEPPVPVPDRRSTLPAEMQPSDGSHPLLARADSLFQGGEARLALAEVEIFLEEDPRSYEGLWRAASLAVAVGMAREEEGEAAEARDWYRRAGQWADAAIEVDPGAVEARYWRLAVLGRDALSVGSREASALGDRIRREALSILDDHPDHPGAHNVLGRLYFEIMSVSGVSRFLGRAFLRGEALREASWEKAEHHLTRAVAEAPGVAMFQLDLGRLLLERDRTVEARAVLERAVTLAESHPPDRIFAREARRLLSEDGG